MCPFGTWTELRRRLRLSKDVDECKPLATVVHFWDMLGAVLPSLFLTGWLASF
jgi:hypothetical protein